MSKEPNNPTDRTTLAPRTKGEKKTCGNLHRELSFFDSLNTHYAWAGARAAEDD